MAGDEWNLVQGRKGRKIRNVNGCTYSKEGAEPLGSREQSASKEVFRSSAAVRTNAEQAQEFISLTLGKVSRAKEEVSKGKSWRLLQAVMPIIEEKFIGALSNDSTAAVSEFWHRVQDIVVLGLGSLSRPESRYQLAFTLLLAERLQGARVEVRDPVFTDLDKRTLESLRCQVLETDEAAFRSVDKPTVFYLPHCSYSLSHNVLVRNWNKKNLRNVCIIGNSFSDIAEMWESSSWLCKNGSRPEAILQSFSGNCVLEESIAEEETCRNAFSGSSVMFVHDLPKANSGTQPKVQWRNLEFLLDRHA